MRRLPIAQIHAVREQLTALLALDDQADEQMRPAQRCYVAGTVAGLEWVVPPGSANTEDPCR